MDGWWMDGGWMVDGWWMDGRWMADGWWMVDGGWWMGCGCGWGADVDVANDRRVRTGDVEAVGVERGEVDGVVPVVLGPPGVNRRVSDLETVNVGGLIK